MSGALRAAAQLTADAHAALRRRMMFEFCKWDPQVGDVSAIAPTPLLLDRRQWMRLAAMAETLEAERIEAERVLIARRDLHSRLGLPRCIRRALAAIREPVAAPGVRVTRYDFHDTTDGWRISEANTDVPGGFIEASALARLSADGLDGAEPPGDPTQRLADRCAALVGPSAQVALVHATAYTDDRQVMVFLARQLEARGLGAHLIGPHQLRWREGVASMATDWRSGPIDLIVRFFPAEWLPALPRGCGWRMHFAGARTPMCNPASAILTQSKRFPLVWDALGVALPTWRALLPETREVRAADWRSDRSWVVKPALGRVGDGVGVHGVTTAERWKPIVRCIRRRPRVWIAQRRFEALPVGVDGGWMYPSVGVFVIDGIAAGAYGRMAARPLIDDEAHDVAVLIARDAEVDVRRESRMHEPAGAV
jgi:glutathionylspermidine synthase